MIKTIFRQKYFKDILKTQNVTFSQQNAVPEKSGTFGSNYKNRRRQIVWTQEEKQLLSVYPEVKTNILDDQLIYHPNRPDVRERYAKFLDYTIFHVPLYYASSLTTIHAYKYFEKPSRLTEENLKLASIIGWILRCSETAMLIIDDVMDNSKVRYNKPTWYSIAGLDESMVDAAFLDMSVCYLLFRHFSKHPQFLNIQREVIKNLSTTYISMMLESKKYKMEEFENNQNFIKAYPFTVPSVASAMYLANIDDPRLHSIAMEVCMDIAQFTKNEDDVECAFQPVTATEKDCTDAAQGRVTWLAVQVAKYGTPAQKKRLMENYGKYEKEALAEVHNVYTEMRLKESFENYQVEFYETTFQKIQNMPKELPGQLFLDVLDYAVMKKYRS